MKKTTIVRRPLIPQVLVLLAFIWLLSISACTPGNAGTGGKPPFMPEEIAEAPSVELPAGTTGEVKVLKSDREIPRFLEGSFVPVSRAWEITFDGHDHYDFGSEKVELYFKYDPEKLTQAGYYPEFVVFVFNDSTEVWERLEASRHEKRGSTHHIVAETYHFSSFLPAAAAMEVDGVSLAENMMHLFPEGIGGTGGAVFSIVDEDYKYYVDRDYYILPASESTINADTFADLGLNGSIGISTYNGGTAAEPYQAHKYFDDRKYIEFKAHMDLDLYLLYDTRGGMGPEDISGDATWLTWQHSPFDAEINNRVYYLETTDPVGLYRVYKRSYSEGDTIELYGNWYDIYSSDDQEVDTESIQTNYWAIIKPMGSTASDSAALISDSVPISGVSLPSDSINIGQYGSATLSATLEPGDASNNAVMWSTSDPTVAYFDPDHHTPWSGTIEANEPGIAEITITTADGGFTDRVTVTVTAGGVLDSDSDGLPDSYEGSGFQLEDTDGDGVDDIYDIDDDGDGIPTRSEYESALRILGYGSYSFCDYDMDGINDYWDQDSDSDGVRDTLEAYGATSAGYPVIVPSGVDDDNDGLDNVFEPYQDLDPFLLPDFDGDGLPDVWDADDDNDLVPTWKEIVYTSERPIFTDTDLDGAPDMIDTDDDNDGFSTRDEDLNRNGKPWDDDSDEDSIPDYLDAE